MACKSWCKCKCALPACACRNADRPFRPRRRGVVQIVNSPPKVQK